MSALLSSMDSIRDLLSAASQPQTALADIAEYLAFEIEGITDDQRRSRVTALVMDGVRRDLESLEPADREAYARSKWLGTVLRRALLRAVVLADRYEESRDDSLRAQAEECEATLRQTAAELEGLPLWSRDRGQELSEAIMDCRYVISGGAVSSMRRGRPR